MKRFLLPLLVSGAALLAAGRAQAQDKPVLNTAPPAAPVPATPAPAPVPTYTPPVYTPPATTPAPAPRASSPSGLDFPAQPAPPPTPLKRYFIYSNFGLGFSSYSGVSQFNGSIAPALGYRVNERFALGPGLSYSYNRYGAPNGYTFGNGESSLSTSSVGIKGFAQLIVYKEFFAHAEYEVTNAELLTQDQYGALSKQRRTVSSPLAGIGYRSQLSENAAADIVVLYNFNDSLFSLYPNPVIRFSFLFNLGR